MAKYRRPKVDMSFLRRGKKNYRFKYHEDTGYLENPPTRGTRVRRMVNDADRGEIVSQTIADSDAKNLIDGLNALSTSTNPPTRDSFDGVADASRNFVTNAEVGAFGGGAIDVIADAVGEEGDGTGQEGTGIGDALWNAIDASKKFLKDNPWIADTAQIGLSAASGILSYKAIKEQGRAEAAHLREQGAFALKKAKREAKDVGIAQDFEEEEAVESFKQTGLFSGQESFAGGTGTDALLTANKNAARQLMDDIIKEGEAQKKMFDDAAAATEEAAKKRGRMGILTTATQLAGTALGGPAGGAAAGQLNKLFTR